MSTRWKLLTEVAPAKPGSGDTPAVGATYRCAYAAEGLHAAPATCFDLFKSSAEAHPHKPCLGWRPVLDGAGTLGPYAWMTYGEAYQRSVKVGSAFLQAGLRPKERVGVLGANCPEWMLAMQGCNRTSMECVPLYDTLGEHAIEFIIKHSGVKFVVAQGAKLPGLAKAFQGASGASLAAQLRGVAYWGEASGAAVQALEAAGVPAVFSWQQLLELGAAHPHDAVPPKPDDISTIMYTSGTTGDPKGVVHTHSSVMACVESIREFLDHNRVGLSSEDVLFSFLPLAHIFDRVVEEVLLMLGASVGYFSGNTRTLLQDCAELKPTVFCAVPRVYERVYAGVMDKVKKSGTAKQLVFNAAMAYKLGWMRLGWDTRSASPLLNKLIFSTTQAAVGGRMRLFISGGAPLPKYAGTFMSVAMCVPVLQGYGLTESCGATIGQDPFDHAMMGTVGLPLPGIDMRLEGVPELGYDPLDAACPRGEVCLRGPTMFREYYKQPDLTAEAVDAEGFFHTGDIGELCGRGALRIIDRKKNIFKLSQGEYVAVEFIESVLGKNALVEQVWLYGNSFESCLVTVVVPNSAPLTAWAQQQGGELAGKDFAALCATQQARDYVLGSLTATGKEAGLKGFELPKGCHLDAHPFSIEQDLVTPKLSLKRPQLARHYRAQIDGMYAALKAAGQAAPAPKAPAAGGGSSKRTPAVA